MNRPIYACDRCGHWYTMDERLAHNDLPYEPNSGTLAMNFAAVQDLCAACTSSLREWFAAGKGAEVKPKSLRRP